MSNLKKSLAAAAALLAVSATSHASIVIQFTGRTIADDLGAAVPAGTLFQLVSLGGDGIFNQINLSDGNASALGQWVSGDDTLITAQFVTFDGVSNVAGDYTAAGFDLAFGTDTPGRLIRQMEFDTNVIASGTKLGIRWFPGLTAEQYKTGNLTLASGQHYGEFTRQSNPQQGGALWVAPGDGGNVQFDSLRTTNLSGGTDPVSAGMATLTVVPEPAALGLALMGAMGVFALRRRR